MNLKISNLKLILKDLNTSFSPSSSIFSNKNIEIDRTRNRIIISLFDCVLLLGTRMKNSHSPQKGREEVFPMNEIALRKMRNVKHQ